MCVLKIDFLKPNVLKQKLIHLPIKLLHRVIMIKQNSKIAYVHAEEMELFIRAVNLYFETHFFCLKCSKYDILLCKI